MAWFGSTATAGLCQPPIAMVPPARDTHIETHLGGGTLMKRKPPQLCNIGIDLDARALEALSCDDPVELDRVHRARFAGQDSTDCLGIPRTAESWGHRIENGNR